jgi:hypothetical protein
MKRDIPWAGALGVYERKAGVAPTIHQPGVWGHVSHIMARELIGDRPVAGSVARTVAA